MNPNKIGKPRSGPRRDRRATPQQRRTGTPTPVSVVSATSSGSVLTVTFDQPVVVAGVPGWVIEGGTDPISPVSARLVSSAVLEVTYDDAVENNPVTVPFESDAVRSRSGGFVNAGTITPVAAPPAVAETQIRSAA